MQSKPSVLLIDDNQATNFLHTRVLKKSQLVGYVKACHGGAEALEYITTANQDDIYPRPDIIFLDINMPGMSGWEFLEAYQALPEDQRGGIVIIMLTTSLNPDDRRRAESYSEINDFQEKPLTVEHLTQILAKHLRT